MGIESSESKEHINEQEILNNLSPAFFKSVQEIIPGRLPDKPIEELKDDEQMLYNEAYAILKNLVAEGKAEGMLREEEAGERIESAIHKERARPVFKLKTDKGAPARDKKEYTGNPVIEY